MQLKRLRKTGAIASEQADESNQIQDISESQLLRELEDLTGGFAADGSKSAKSQGATPLAATASAATAAGSSATPATEFGSRRGRSGSLTSSAKRQRRQLQSLFGSQEDEQQQQPQLGVGLGLNNNAGQQKQVSPAAK